MKINTYIKYFENSASISFDLDGLSLEKGAEVCSFVLLMTGIGDDINTAIDLQTLEITDENGALPVSFSDYACPPRVKRKIISERPSNGNISIKYTAKFLPARRNPILDMGIEPGGILGAGENFLLSFEQKNVDFTVKTDLSALPEGSGAAWTYGGTDDSFTANGDILTSSYFCVGDVKRVENGAFGYYWLDNNVDLRETAETAESLFHTISGFFGDNGAPYRIFARCRATSICGGTAGARSYAYIYPPGKHPAVNDLKLLFSHEIVHNWTTMEDMPYGISTWYQEGIADLYSVSLAYRFGFISREELVIDLNAKARQYYENPRISMKNDALGKLLFKDLEATTVPYGRGFFYIMKTDADIRRATNGEHSVDDIIFTLLNADKRPDNEAWLSAVNDILGYGVRDEFEAMQNGKIYPPDPMCFSDAKLKIKEAAGVSRVTETPCKLWLFE